jgi:hypothetical protein
LLEDAKGAGADVAAVVLPDGAPRAGKTATQDLIAGVDTSALRKDAKGAFVLLDVVRS